MHQRWRPFTAEVAGAALGVVGWAAGHWGWACLNALPSRSNASHPPSPPPFPPAQCAGADRGLRHSEARGWGADKGTTAASWHTRPLL